MYKKSVKEILRICIRQYDELKDQIFIKNENGKNSDYFAFDFDGNLNL